MKEKHTYGPNDTSGVVWAFFVFEGLCWPSLAVIGCCGPSWTCVGCCGPSLTCVGLRWPSLAAMGFCGPALAFGGRRWLLWEFVVNQMAEKNCKKHTYGPNDVSGGVWALFCG